MIIYNPPKTPDTIPLIDLSDSFSPDLERRKAVAWAMHKAARETGIERAYLQRLIKKYDLKTE